MLESERRTTELMKWLEDSRRDFLKAQGDANKQFIKREGTINRRYTIITIAIGLVIVIFNALNRCAPVQQSRPLPPVEANQSAE